MSLETFPTSLQRQRGAVLMVSLILLLVLSMLGISTMQGANMEERMAGNLRDQALAFQAADSALRDGEGWIGNLTVVPSADCSAGGCTVWALDSPGLFVDLDLNWWQGNGRAYSGNLAKVKTRPTFVIEQHSFQPDSLKSGFASPAGLYVYRVTSHGTGGSNNAEALLQSTYSRRF